MTDGADRSPQAVLDLADVEATRRLGARLAAALRESDVVCLRGDLGTGKTELARAVIRARAGAPVEVPSPTFTLVQDYDLPGLHIWHLDLFRIVDPDEVFELGYEEALETGAVLIEWPDRIEALLPEDRLEILLEDGPDAGARRATIAAGPNWRDRLPVIAAGR